MSLLEAPPGVSSISCRVSCIAAKLKASGSDDIAPKPPRRCPSLSKLRLETKLQMNIKIKFNSSGLLLQVSGLMLQASMLQGFRCDASGYDSKEQECRRSESKSKNACAIVERLFVLFRLGVSITNEFRLSAAANVLKTTADLLLF